MSNYQLPSYNKEAFNCPHCLTYSHQTWFNTRRINARLGSIDVDEIKFAICTCCGKYSLWQNEKMLYPEETGILPPNQDLSEDVKKDYNEARSILRQSPRGAAALLRLALQKLCKDLGESGNNINDDIGELVKKGLPVIIQQALDIVRVIGNESVHPGQIDLNDDPDTAQRLFELINLIAQVMITQPKEVQKLYDKLPEPKLQGIIKRDK